MLDMSKARAAIRRERAEGGDYIPQSQRKALMFVVIAAASALVAFGLYVAIVLVFFP